ncbi:hypothetical protein ASPZODRAFT_129396 [Penicilliopsis zonata CBS 506.65]|uniref:Metallothionein n=1 Tax=Penicilliopsis zonata CBS 506.65 TaxID=1073090 RepID=A0A1L9SP45_9EURO|nr:hypothetical protein ASPZODRAFT_129396 [Penicilliopsis zonata CBS 506.65]OJJ49022.1 hypothetical protein ASPZODRAFT_129396 [Penicilliopsis zonata CBS 506.65]
MPCSCGATECPCTGTQTCTCDSSCTCQGCKVCYLQDPLTETGAPVSKGIDMMG